LAVNVFIVVMWIFIVKVIVSVNAPLESRLTTH